MLVSLGINRQISFASIRWLCTVNHRSFEVDCPVYEAYKVYFIPSHITPVHIPIPLYIINFNITLQHALNTANDLLSSGFLGACLHVLSLPADMQIGKYVYFQLTWTYMHIYVCIYIYIYIYMCVCVCVCVCVYTHTNKD